MYCLNEIPGRELSLLPRNKRHSLLLSVGVGMKADLAVLCQLHPLALFQVLWLVIVSLQVWLGWEVNINSTIDDGGYKKPTFWCDFDANVRNLGEAKEVGILFRGVLPY